MAKSGRRAKPPPDAAPPDPPKPRARRGPKPNRPEASAELPKPPHWIAADLVAQGVWCDLVTVLAPYGFLGPADAFALGQLCHLFSKWHKATAKVRDDKEGEVITSPNKYKQVNPWESLAIQYQKDMKPYMDMLGLSPKARSKFKLPEAGDDDDGKWEEFK